MAVTVIADSSFLVALLSRRDARHVWAVSSSAQLGGPWHTCEAALMESFYLIRPHGASSLIGVLRSGELRISFDFAQNQDSVLALMEKYATVPMSLADACLVRMTEILPDPVILTTDADFRIYRRHSRQVVPCMMPSDR
jgi:predicted nucleic acid-binding protein